MKRYTCIFYLALAALCLAGCGTPEKQADAPQQQPVETATQAPTIAAESERLYEEGAKAYGELDYDKAVAAFSRAIDKDGRNYKAWSGKGVALAMRGNASGNKDDVARGIEDIQTALSIYPQYVPSFYDLALAYKIDGQYDKAISYFQKVIAADPANTWSYYGIATIYGDKGDAGKAVAYLKKAAALDKENVLEAARTQSHFDSIRNDPAFQDLMGGN